MNEHKLPNNYNEVKMHSNFITAPDYVESILIIGATEDEIKDCAEAVKELNTSFNVYFYNPEVPNVDWLNKIMFRVDTILLQETQLSFTVPTPLGFGPNCVLKSPCDYFAK